MKAATWAKMLAGYDYLQSRRKHIRLTRLRGAVMCVGGPALVYYVMPTEEELFLVGRPAKPL
jgi:hypothetical protein